MKHGDNFALSILPGKNEGISGSCIAGYSIGINKYISDEKKEHSAQILNYILSSEFQRKINMDRGYQSGLKEFYDDSDQCQQYSQCQSLKMSQLLMKPINATNNYRIYSSKFRNYLSKYLYRDSDLEDCLFNIRQLTKVYYQENSSTLNKIILFMITVSYIFMIVSYCLAFTKKHRYKFRLLNKFYWFIYILGLALMMAYGHTAIGVLNDVKCKIRPLLISVGFTLSNTLLLIRMLINFPESNRRFVRFCEKHFGFSVIIAISIDVILNILLLFNSYEVYTITDGDLLYNTCEMKSFKGHMFLGFIYLYKIFIILSLYIVTFLEWNLKEFKEDIHYMAGVLFITSIIYIIYGTISLIKIKGLVEEFIIPTVILYIYGFSNFLIYFFSRFFLEKEKDDDEKINIKNYRYNPGSKMELTKKYSSSNSLNQTSSNGSGRKMSIAGRLISMHTFGEEIKKSSDLIKNSNHSSTSSLSGSHLFMMKKYSASAVNINNNNYNNDERDIFNRRTSQITSIPENKVADYSTSRISEKSQSTENSFESNSNSNSNNNNNNNKNSRSRTHSYDNFLPNFHRVTRINSGSTKLSNTHLEKKNSSISFSQIQPINASSAVSRISSKSSITQSNENISKVSSQKINSISSFSSDKINSYTKSNEIVSVEIQEISSNEESEITTNKTDQ